MSESTGRLREWDAGVRQLAEQAEARIAEANEMIRELHQFRQLKPRVLLGSVLSIRPYDPGCGPEDSGQVTQAVLLIPEGLGVVFWDTEDLQTFPDGPERCQEARRQFTPIAECRPLLRIQFLPFAVELVAKMKRYLHQG